MSSFKPQTLLLYLTVGTLVLALYTSDSNLQSTAEVLRDSLVAAWSFSLLNFVVLGNGLGRLLGIRPRQLWGLVGIVCAPFLHRDFSHLVANTVPFMVLGWLILLQSEIQGTSDFYAITLTVALIGGLGTWLFGREAVHMGASGLVFGYIGYLLTGAYIGRTLITLALGLIVLLMYGNQLWGILPNKGENQISWEGHLFGFAGGIIAGVEPELLEKLSAKADGDGVVLTYGPIA